MNALLDQLGINWQLFLSQAVNFFILLIVLTFFVYKPLIKIIKKRNAKIKEGLDKAEEADVRLKQIDVISKEKLKEAGELVKKAIIKTVGLNPDKIDEALIKKAVSQIKDEA